MDPTMTLAELREAIEQYHRYADHCEFNMGTDVATLWEIGDAIVTRFEALDNWLSRKGFAPTAWERREPCA